VGAALIFGLPALTSALLAVLSGPPTLLVVAAKAAGAGAMLEICG